MLLARHLGILADRPSDTTRPFIDVRYDGRYAHSELGAGLGGAAPPVAKMPEQRVVRDVAEPNGVQRCDDEAVPEQYAVRTQAGQKSCAMLRRTAGWGRDRLGS